MPYDTSDAETATPDPKPRSPRVPLLCAVALMLAGFSSLVASEVLDAAPRAFYPFESYTAKFIATDTQVLPVPTSQPGDPTPEPNIEPSERRFALRVTAHVDVERPIPTSAKRGPYHPRRNPAPDYALRRAGPERAVSVRLLATQYSGGTLRTLDWPAPSPGQQGPFGLPVEAFPDATAQRILPLLGDNILVQSGDPLVAGAARAGGSTRPNMATASHPMAGPLGVIGWVLIVASAPFHMVASFRKEAPRRPEVDKSLRA